MRVIWAAFGVTLAAGIATLTTVAWTTWIRDCPQDLVLTELSAGPMSSYADVAFLAEGRKAASKPEINVLQVSFTSGTDLRQMAVTERWAYSEFTFAPCDCNETATQQHKTCAKSVFPTFDPSGWINSYNHSIASSRRRPDDKSVPYRIYIDLTPWEPEKGWYDLTKEPTDLCIQFVRKSLFLPDRKSNIIKIEKERLVSALAISRTVQDTGNAMKSIGVNPLARPLGEDTVEPILTNPLKAQH